MRGKSKDKKKRLFTRLSEEFRDALRLHETPGRLWEKEADGRDWRSVTEHCLIEAARAKVFAKKLALAPDVARDLAAAAAVHDFYKKRDIELTKEDLARGGTGRQGYLASEKEAEAHLLRAGMPERVIRIASTSNGEPDTVLEMKKIVDKGKPADEEIALLVMHYVDGYTQGSEWTLPAEDGLNDIDRRAERNSNNPDYRKMDGEGYGLYRGTFFEGKGRFGAQRTAGHLIEQKLSELIRARSEETIEPIRLPEAIDETIKSSLSSL